MAYQKVLEVHTGKEQAQQLFYDKVVLMRSKHGNWLYAGYGGPKQRYVCLLDSVVDHEPEPDVFLIPAEEAYKIILEEENPDLLEKFFPETLCN